jgi:hypothetical protein
MAKERKPNQKMQEWIDARKRHHLSDSQVQMARELGMNPKKLGKLDNHGQESWKMPLREYIEHLYLKRFGKPSPDKITSVEEQLRRAREKKKARRASRRQLSKEAPSDDTTPMRESSRLMWRFPSS